MKKYMLGFFALILAIGMSAFTVRTTENDGAFDDVWFVYNGGGEGTASNYSINGTGEFPPSCNEQTGVRCAIRAPQIGAYPDLMHISAERLKVSQP